jgi:PAS domain S-box-containing protein
VQPLRRDEIERLVRVDAGRGPVAARNRALIRVLAGAGLGVGEALALEPGDIDPVEGVRVRGARDRVVGLAGDGMRDLLAWRAERELGLGPSGPLFCTMAGAALEASYVRRLLARLGRRAGIDRTLNARTLRESFAAARIAGGASPSELRAQLGHASLASTRRYVRHLASPPDATNGRLEPELSDALLTHAHCGLIVVRAERDATGVIQDFVVDYVNPAAAGMFGSSPELVVGRRVSERYPAAHSDGTFDRWAALIAEQGCTGEPSRRAEVGGREVWTGVRRAAIGERVVLSIADVSALRDAGRARARAEERYQAISSASREGHLILDADGRIATANEAAGRILGVARESLVGRSCLDPRWQAVGPDGSEVLGAERPSSVTTATGRAVADRILGIRRPEGRMVWISVSTEALEGGGGPPFAVAVAFSELTGARLAARRARGAEQAAQLVSEALDALLLRCAPDGLILSASGASERLVGCAPDELPGLRCEDGVVPGDRALVRAAYVEAMQSTQAVCIEHGVLHRSGGPRPVTRTLRAVRDPASGEVEEVQSLLRLRPAARGVRPRAGSGRARRASTGVGTAPPSRGA